MSLLVTDCPRCGSKGHTFDVPAFVRRPDTAAAHWQRRGEVFAICRYCRRPSIFILQVENYHSNSIYDDNSFWTNGANNLNDVFEVIGYVSQRENVARKSPAHTPVEIAAVFDEGATCMAVGCHNAAGTMFRLCLDLATRRLLPPPPEDGADLQEGAPNRRQRRDLGLRIPWLIANELLPSDLADLAEVVREDGNDGAHAGLLTNVEAEDLADFTEVLLERLYTEPRRVQIAQERRAARRAPPPDA